MTMNMLTRVHSPSVKLSHRLRKISADEVALRQSLFACSRSLQLSTDSGGTSFTIHGTANETIDETVELRGHRQLIQVSVIRDVFCQPLGDQDWSDFQGKSRLMAWCVAHETLLGYLETVFGQPLVPLRMYRRNGKAARKSKQLTLGFTVKNGKTTDAGKGVMHLPVTWARRLLLGSTAQPMPFRSNLIGKLPIELSLQLPGPQVQIAALQGVRLGDTIILGPFEAVFNRFLLCVDNVTWFRANHRNGALRITSARYREFPVAMEKSLVNQDTNEVRSTQSVDDDVRIPVTLQFEIGSLTLTFDEVSQLQPGYVFTLPAPVAGTNVRIHANGQVVGHGQMVIAGENIGVSVNRWADIGVQ